MWPLFELELSQDSTQISATLFQPNMVFEDQVKTFTNYLNP